MHLSLGLISLNFRQYSIYLIYFIVSAESYCKVKNTLPNTFIVFYLSQYMRKNRKTVFQLSVSRKTKVNVNNLSIKAVGTIYS